VSDIYTPLVVAVLLAIVYDTVESIVPLTFVSVIFHLLAVSVVPDVTGVSGVIPSYKVIDV